MPIPEIDLARVKRFCDERVSAKAVDQVRLEVEVEEGTITILERRAPWPPVYGPEWTRLPIARLRYTGKTKLWSLYWRDRNCRFHQYDRLPPSPQVSVLLEEVARDPTCIFWG
jgi:hypothetical protein